MNRRLRGPLAGILSTAALAVIGMVSSTWFGTEWLLRDLFSRTLARSRPPDPRIVVVALSETTASVLADFYGRPQSYSREVYARAVEELQRAGAAVVAIDLLFAEENPADPAGDRRFADVLDSAPVVLGANTGRAARAGAPVDPRLLWRITGTAPVEPGEATLPHPAFRAQASIGTMRMVTSRQSATIHDYRLADAVQGGFVPSLALETARHFLRADRAGEIRSTINGRRFRFAGRDVPVNASLDMTIRWNGAKASPRVLSYPTVGLEKLIQASLAREEGLETPARLAEFGRQFQGKIVLIGLTAVGLDLRATPLSPTAAGVEIHANAIDNLIEADFTTVVRPWLIFPFIAIAAALLGTLIDRIRSQAAAAAIALGAIALVLAAAYGALAAGYAVPAVAAAGSMGLTYISITVVNFVAEQEQTRQLRTTFGRYVSPQILTHILAHPESVRLGGDRRDLTILFSDIRGFTTISEASEPEEVVEMLNEYLTRMVEILLAHGGTLDKFIGDAVMGFWNAPAADPDHARHAVACAVEMVQETARLRAQWEAAGKAAIRIGVGVNTGDAVVGNIGAEKVFGYTVIGDAVNLASRLEGKNKDYGTEIIISEFTLLRIGDAFDTVYLDDVKVKGKEKAVKIYQVRVPEAHA